MIIINFSHPLTPEQTQTVETLTDHPVERVIDIKTHIDVQQPLAPQVTKLVDQVKISAGEWQTRRILINLPALNFIAAALLAELHGRCGFFVPILRLRPVAGSLPPRYEVAEIIDLRRVRLNARINNG